MTQSLPQNITPAMGPGAGYAAESELMRYTAYQ